MGAIIIAEPAVPSQRVRSEAFATDNQATVSQVIQTRKNINLDGFQKIFVGKSRMRKDVFGSYVMGAGVAAAFSDASTN